MLPLGDRLGRVVILNTAAFADTVIPARIRFCRIPVIGEIAVRGFNAFARPATWMAVTKPLPQAVKDGFLFPYNSWANRIATHRFVRDIPKNKGRANDLALAAVEKALPQLRTKSVRILWGGQDFCFNEHYYRRWTALLPEAKADYLPEAGHYLLEDAREYGVAEIARHLV
jgi:haloalkane dehalogenase